MHIIRLDIDRKNSAEHLQVGPLSNGLNAIYAPIHGASDTLARFLRNLLFRGSNALAPIGDDFTDSLDGSLQWVDASGHVRMMSTSSGATQSPNRFLHSPLHPSQRPIHAEDGQRLSGLGNMFWDGDERDHRWDELRGDILGMIFCSPLGSVSPEKLWWAASRLGVHAHAKSQLDEGYQRLKAEEQDLLERLRHVENVDHDRAWWSIERDRIAAELAHVQSVNTIARAPVSSPLNDSVANPLRERLASIQIEISRLRAQIQELLINEANAKLDSHRREDHRMNFANVGLHQPSVASTNGYGRPTPSRSEFENERVRFQTRIEHLLAEQANVEIQLKNTQPTVDPVSTPSMRWDDSQLRAQHAHAEEMIRRWDKRSQSHRRLTEIQSHLRTRSPYRRTTEGSLIPKVEKYLRDLTSGAARQLPVWAVEASYLHQQDNFSHAYHSLPTTAHTEYGARHEYFDRMVPTENTRQRKLVDLAMRLAIADAAVARVGRIPLLLDDTISAFRGETLEQILHVLATFARDGRQMLVSTNDEYTARRIAAHGGSVARMQDIMRFARPNYVLDGATENGLHPSLDRSSATMLSSLPANEGRMWRVVGLDGPQGEIVEVNRQLAGLANEQAMYSWWHPELAPRSATNQTRYVEQSVPASATRRTFLQPESNINEVPGVDREFARRLHSQGVYRVADLLKANASLLGPRIRVEPSMIEQAQQVSDLMCGTPMLRAFDAQVLVGCGITHAGMLRELAASDLVDRVERYLSSFAGQDLVRGASSFEVSRIHGWLADMKRSISQRGSRRTDRNSGNSSYVRSREPRATQERYRTDSPRQRESRSDFNQEPRIASDRDFDREQRTRIDREHREPQMRPRVMRASQTRTEGESSGIRAARSSASSTNTTSSQWKFYLDIDSDVVDGPSIGPRMAEKLAPFGVATVGDLVASDAVTLASQLADKHVTAATVEQWQQQALLVCRIPNLRGHDAQLLVGAGYTTAEDVAAADVSVMFDKVSRFASSKGGVRILRGTAAPDLAEVTDWIQWSQNCRAIRAA